MLWETPRTELAGRRSTGDWGSRAVDARAADLLFVNCHWSLVIYNEAHA